MLVVSSSATSTVLPRLRTAMKYRLPATFTYPPPEFEQQQRRAVEGEEILARLEGWKAPVGFRFNAGFRDA